ncbi:MAG: MFS transporter, partial [archaeon]|nr:MFS transporter [archaeon]
SSVALILLCATAFDAMTDLLFGLVTDSTRSLFGRRRPYILLGSIAWCGCFIALFQTPGLVGLSGRQAYYISFLLLYKGANTIPTVPYYSLVSEITPSYTERTKLSGLRLIVSLSSAMIVSFAWALISVSFPLREDPSQPNKQLGYSVASMMFVPLIVLPAVGVFSQVKEPPMAKKSKKQADQDWRYLLRSIFSNRSFVCVVAIYLLIFTSINFVQNNLLLWVTYVLKAPKQFQWLVLALQFCSLVSVFLWIPVANRIGKRNAYMIATLPIILVMAANWLVTENTIYLAFIMAVVGGLCIGALMLMPWSMMADCVDVDELETGRRREGIYFATFVLFQKFALAIALAASNYSLAAAGYVNHPQGAIDAGVQPEDVSLVLKVMVGPVVAICSAASLIPAFFYPLSKEKHAEITEQLKERRKRDAETRRTTRRTKRGFPVHHPEDTTDMPLESESIESEKHALLAHVEE